MPTGPDQPAAAALPWAPARPALPGRVPAPRTPAARARTVPGPDVVDFVARCPGCGRDALWHEQREDTRLRATIDCAC